MKGFRRYWPFGLLCVAASTVWMVEDTWPTVRLTLAASCVACGLMALVAGCWADA